MTATPVAPATTSSGVRRLRRPDEVVVSSTWMLATMALMSASGMAFWLLAARLQAPAEVGYAGSLVTAMTVLSLFAQLGLEVTLVQVLPTSSRPLGDVLWVSGVVGLVGAGLGAAYAVVLGVFSEELAGVVGGPLGAGQFALLVAAVSVNTVSDSVLLAVSRLRANLVVNGLVMSAVKLALPFVLVSSGAMGLVLAVGLAALVAAVLSVVVVVRTLPAPQPLRRPSRELLAARRFAGAGYVVSVLDVAPFLVFPVLVIHAHGAATGAAYFLAFQVMVLLLAVGFTLNNAMYAEVAKRPAEATALVRRSGLMIGGAMTAGALVLVLVAPLVMRVFGTEYVAEGTVMLRVLAGGAVVAQLASWSALRLRVAGRLRPMLATYLLGTVLVLVLAWWWVGLGIWGVPLAWAVGRGATLVINLVLGVHR